MSKWSVVKCPKCASTNCFPTDIDDGAQCVPCGCEFSMTTGEPAAAPAAPQPTEEMVERVAELIATRYPVKECASAIITLLGPHFRNEGKEAAAKLLTDICNCAVCAAFAEDIRASKEPT